MDELLLPAANIPTTQHWLAGVLHTLARRIEGSKSPAYPELARDRLAATRVALLDAESEKERWNNTVHMLRQRVVRLTKESS
jgi:hypothetical protein